MAVGEMVCLVNRVWFPLTVTKNGVQRILQPGPNYLTADWIRFAKLQNPHMGTFVPGTIDGDYLVGVEGVDNCDMISPDDAGLGKEKFDRSGDIAEGKIIEVQQTGIRGTTRMGDAGLQSLSAEFNGRQS